MKSRVFFLFIGMVLAFQLKAQIPVLKRSDVMFIYQADPTIYKDYGTTIVGWGGQRTEDTKGIKFFGSVGMVTEFGQYYDRFPQTYEQGLCRNLQGKPYTVPWLTDQKHKGVPFWWCCTRQPVFRQYIRERVVEIIKGGSDGLHVDDHLGTAGSLFLDGCFCDLCVSEFPAYLAKLSDEKSSRIPRATNYNFKAVLTEWLAQDTQRKVEAHPLWPIWKAYQLRGAASFIQELRELAAQTAGKPMPVAVNAGLLWPTHLSDYRSVDLFSAEIDHQASARHFPDNPLTAYRLADAAGRPLAATASGGDWAFIKEENRSGLVQGWIATGYAAGNCLMAPNHQWCYTTEKGTHWYDGPKEKYAPLYQFVRQNAALFDDAQTCADVTVAFSYKTFCQDSTRVLKICSQLFAANISYRIALGGDDVVDIALPANLSNTTSPVLTIEPNDFLASDRKVLASVPECWQATDVAKAIAMTKPAVRVESSTPVRALPRVKPGAALIHLLNWNYDAARDTTPQGHDILLQLDLSALGVPKATKARLYRPDAPVVNIDLSEGKVKIPELGLWGVLEIH